MLWIIYSSDSFNWNTSWLIFFMILKGLYLFWSSFFEGQFEWIFLASNHILSPFNPCGFCLFLSNYFFIAFFAIPIDFFATSQLLYSTSRKSSRFGNYIRSSFHRYLPKFNLNEVCPVAICFLSLYWNFTTNNHSVQLSCW